MIKAVFFDLDGTLLSFKNEDFMRIYFGNLYKYCFDKEKFTFKQAGDCLFYAISNMVKDDGMDRTALEKFYYYFSQITKEGVETYLPKFEKFYFSEGYDEVKTITKPLQNMIDAVHYLNEHGIIVCLTTNPFFPDYAIRKRIEWAGLKEDDFKFITFSEVFHFNKPNLLYYKECMAQLPELKPEEILMVGNDVDEDMITSNLGLQTYLLTNNMITRYGNEKDILVKGSDEDFLKYVKEYIK